MSSPTPLSGLLIAFVLGGCPGPAAGPLPAEVEEDERLTPVALEPPAPPRDLDAIRDSGELRVLIRRPEATLPREGSHLEATLGRVERVAAELGVEIRYLTAETRDDLVEALLAGKGDLIAGRLIGGGPGLEQLALTAPVRSASEVVVIARAATGALGAPPATLEELDGRVVAASRWLPSHEKLSNARLLDDHIDPAEVLARVGAGEYGAALAFTEDLDEYVAYRDDVRRAFTSLEAVPLSWAVRKDAPALLHAINGALFEGVLTGHTDETFTGDLAGIRERGVLRVAMQNDGASYFLYRGHQMGFQYELAKRMARWMGKDIRLQVVVPNKPNDMVRLVREGRADLAVAAISPELRAGLAISVPYLHANQVLVQPAAEPPVTDLAELDGRPIHVRTSSAYHQTLEELRREHPSLRVLPAREDLSTAELIRRVGQGELPLTVANSALLNIELTYTDDVQGTLVLAESQPLAYGMRPGAKELEAWINKFLAREMRSRTFKRLYSKYFENPRRMRGLVSARSTTTGQISPFDDLAREFGSRYGIDWRLIVAQMHQESLFRPTIRSWCGAVGLMQIMPKTGRYLGFRRLTHPRSNVHAGVKYMAELIERFEPTLDQRQRIRFALASYNAGSHHVQDARILAREMGWNPDRWFGNVERAIVLLEQRKYHRRARHGYCRGSEPREYVSRIQAKYDAYVELVPAETD